MFLEKLYNNCNDVKPFIIAVLCLQHLRGKVFDRKTITSSYYYWQLGHGENMVSQSSCV